MIFAIDPVQFMIAVLTIGGIVGVALFVLTNALGRMVSGITNRGKMKRSSHEPSNS